MATIKLKDALAALNKENCTFYLKLLAHIEEEKMESWDVRTYLHNLSESVVNTLTDTQIYMLDSMAYKRGNSINISYTYNNATYKPPIVTRMKSMPMAVIIIPSLADVTSEDLKYLTQYHKNQWRKLNPTNKYTKGTQLNFTMDEFSLTIFRNSVTKAMARTEAKNYIIKINKGFDASAKDQHAVKIRNKFYHTVLANTANHTKVLLNTLRSTQLIFDDNKYYIPDADEVLRVFLDWRVSPLIALNTSYCQDTWSGDLALVTHSKYIDYEDERTQYRLVAAASVLLTLHERTGAEAYTALAEGMLTVVSDKTKNEVTQMTNAVNSLRSIIKTGDTNE